MTMPPIDSGTAAAQRLARELRELRFPAEQGCRLREEAARMIEQLVAERDAYAIGRGSAIPRQQAATAAPPPLRLWRRTSREREVAELLAWLQQLAAEGQPAPTNDAICGRFGFASTSSASDLLRLLEARGLVLVLRGQNCRVVQAADGGWRTAGAILSAHRGRVVAA